MILRILFNQTIAIILFISGIVLGAAAHILFGLLTILGGLLLGFSHYVQDLTPQDPKPTLLFYAAFSSLLILFTIAYVIFSSVLF
ncbi:hypothetical protein [Halobacillus sp. Marseille-Q1614]|uniref:hypothetical protein n=1 Tax=Halobacillus sp. Marseille-Q1614 TaxID=2709134 RepID=UPI0015705892|nr:hypothetical protein [Halobacillus sp. Marseille-Q1614]